ncbi:hypothetical protein TRIATDRAFT_277498 [Trichoderma atroviride IMI 206040]|uniref:Uncharacterized protein n=1 Tax=Hypocrea atroviridis (strain ATCC 20476 / IMI 206040) TaxID=452589 RepID=G9P465_HYPAI|nr:uncharacterized protein TRIATDRAFT_277498 [Trichoderma atroviride IMI 206040]EHK41120.1 hypothetical protein TRIATDRAFT_277498 [Trichoderma atroviride IMI 206040]
MYLRQVPPRDHHYRSKDHAFRVSFSAPLDKNPPRLSREGYIRALEVYGREDVLFGCLKSSVGRFNEWRKQNPGDLDLYRRHVNSLGYDWEWGSVTEEGIYTSYVCATATGGPPTYDPNNPPSPEDSPVLPRDTSQFIHTDDISETVEEFMTRGPDGRFAATNRQQTNIPSRSLRIRTTDFQTPASFSRTPVVVKDIPVILRGAPGNLRFVPGEDQKNALGAASLFHVTLAMLRGMVEDPEGIAAEDMADIKAMLNYVGEEDSERFVKGFQEDLVPQGQRRFAIFP